MGFRYRLTAEQLDEWNERGYFAIPDVFRKNEIAEIGACLDRLREMAKAIRTTTVHKGAQFVVEGNRIDRIVWCGAAEPKLLDYGVDPRILEPVAQLLESREMQQLICQFHPKLPGDNVGFEWHQDSQHRGWGTPAWTDVNGKGSYVQTLLAIDEVTNENGPVLFVPGSHKLGHLALDKNRADQFVDLKKAEPLLMQPGTLAFFGPCVVHGSFPNDSDKPRRVFINGYAAPGANHKEYPGEGSGRMLKI